VTQGRNWQSVLGSGLGQTGYDLIERQAAKNLLVNSEMYGGERFAGEGGVEHACGKASIEITARSLHADDSQPVLPAVLGYRERPPRGSVDISSFKSHNSTVL
ncbi:MAG: hypothetical protein HY537_06610, partial [Deltaproteobacteria bacterium]|nr:hypothetical protein [Deltaproteobacteria bacterium]